MTYKEYITSTCSRFNVSPSDIDLILINQASSIPDADAEVDTIIARKAICKEFALLIPTYTSMTEGGMTLSVNIEGLKMWYKATCAEVGIPDSISRPTVRNKSNIW